MNATANVQSNHDLRNLPTNQVGIEDPRFPVSLRNKEGEQFTIARLTTTIFLPANQKGTHMSRFVALVEKQIDVLDFDMLHRLITDMVTLLDSCSDKISMSFPSFRKEGAPVSGIQSLSDYDVTPIGETKNGTCSHSLKVMVPVIFLCPCSKEISQYSAHNQRSHVTVSPAADADIGIKEIIDYTEARASCQLYSLFKHSDKKYVMERTYKNPKFVEGMVHNVVMMLIVDKHIEPSIAEGENFELIHDHSAYTRIAYP